MATRTGLGYAAVGIVVAGSIIVATAAIVGLRTQQAREVPAPSTLESALVANAAPAPVAPAPAAPAGVVTSMAAATAGTATQPVTQPFAAAQPLVQPAAPQPLTQSIAARRHDDDDDDDEHEEPRGRESSRNVFTTFRREHR